MTNEEILQKAIEKAGKTNQRMAAISKDYKEIVKMLGFRQLYYETIFSHDFAKAFWGEEIIDAVPGYTLSDGWSKGYKGVEWQYHLQQMVLEEDPLKYLEQFLTKG